MQAQAALPEPKRPALERAMGRVLGWLDVRKRDGAELRLAQLVATGVPVKSIDHLLRVGYSQRDLAWIVKPRTLDRRRKSKGALLDVSESERMIRALKIQALANEVFGDPKKAKRWLDKPRKQFGDMPAGALMQTEPGSRVVEQALQRLDAGYWA